MNKFFIPELESKILIFNAQLPFYDMTKVWYGNSTKGVWDLLVLAIIEGFVRVVLLACYIVNEIII